MPVIKKKTPAKINLLLSILKRRLDNYHEIETIFQAVSLFDVLTIDYRESNDLRIRIKSNSTEMPTDSSNLVYKASELFFKKTKTKADITIKIEKNIPMTAGLGGGSSDAASTLNALNKINNYPLDKNEIKKIAYKLGADVNFFINSGTALGKGIGDILEPLPSPNFGVVLLKPKNVYIKSGWAYEKYAALSIKPALKRSFEMIEGIKNNDLNLITKNMFNSLEYAVFKEYPDLKRYKDLLVSHGCLSSMLSGSGPTIFGITETEEQAKNIADSINDPEVDVWGTKTISDLIGIN